MQIYRVLTFLFCFTLALPGAAQVPPGCYTPRFSTSDVQLREQAVKAAEQEHGGGSSQVADALIFLADVYLEMQPQRATIALTRALKIREQKFGTQSEEATATKILVAECYLQQGQNALAEPLLQESLTTREKLFGKNDRRLVPVLYDLSQCYAAAPAKRAGDALPIIARAQRLSDTAYGSNSAHSYELQAMLACAYRALGKHQLAQQTDERAQSILAQLNNPFLGSGTARRLNLEPLLAAEDAKASRK